MYFWPLPEIRAVMRLSAVTASFVLNQNNIIPSSYCNLWTESEVWERKALNPSYICHSSIYLIEPSDYLSKLNCAPQSLSLSEVGTNQVAVDMVGCPLESEEVILY